MALKTLNEYDFDSTYKYLSELGEHIAGKTKGKIRIVSIVVNTEDHELSCGSTVAKHKLFSILLIALINILPNKSSNLDDASSSASIVRDIIEKIKASE